MAYRKHPNNIYLTLTEDEMLILKTLGNDRDQVGARVAIQWASHFYNLGLRPDFDINCIGLCLMADNEID
jgi:hypothetical protein